MRVNKEEKYYVVLVGFDIFLAAGAQNRTEVKKQVVKTEGTGGQGGLQAGVNVSTRSSRRSPPPMFASTRVSWVI